MSQRRIIVCVSPAGETEVRTEGFTGSSCRQASQFLESALGKQQAEHLTPAFYQRQAASSQASLKQGEAP